MFLQNRFIDTQKTVTFKTLFRTLKLGSTHITVNNLIQRLVDSPQPSSMGNDPIKQAKKDGTINEKNQYNHKISRQEINCPNMIKLKSTNPLHCKIYYNMTHKYEYNQKNLDHLKQYRHHQNAHEQKPKCKYSDECKTYIRSENGKDRSKYQIDDQCHMFIYRHPPRTRQIELAKKYSFIGY